MSNNQKEGKDPLWVKAQAKAFSGWVNSNVGSDCKVKNLRTDLSNGLVLVRLLEALERKKLFKKCHDAKRCKSMIFRLENVRLVFVFLQKEHNFNLTGLLPAGPTSCVCYLRL